MRMMLLSACLLLGSAARVAAQDGPQAIVEKAIQAHGGEAQLAAVKAGQARSRGTIHLPGQDVIAFTAEAYTQAPARFKNVMNFTLMGTAYVQTQVLNGDRAWINLNGKTQELDPPAVADLRENVHAERVAGLLVLRQKDYQLTPVAEQQVHQRPAVGLRVACKDHRDLVLYFDRDSGLLVKTVQRVIDPRTKQEVVQEKLFSGFRASHGVQRPTRVAVVRDGRPFLDIELLEFTPVAQFPESVFAMP